MAVYSWAYYVPLSSWRAVLCFIMLKMGQVLGGEEKEHERERDNTKVLLCLNPVFPHVFDLGTLFSQITFRISLKSSKKPVWEQVALSD